MEYFLIIICALAAAALLVLIVLRALAVRDKWRAYQCALQKRAAAKPPRKYCLEIIQQDGKIRLESGSQILPDEVREDEL